MNSDASAAQPDYEAMARTADYAEALIRAWSRDPGETP
jgi:hypothetical protein